MRRANAYLDRLPIELYGLICGLFVAACDTGIFLATGKSTGAAIGTGIAAGIGGGFGCAIGRDHRSQWRKALSRRFAKRS
jgi:hypothetical protein